MTSYKESGVDVDSGNDFVKFLRPLIKNTWDKKVVTDLNSFAALYKISKDKYLAAGTDGVGTKLLVAKAMLKYDTIGIDLVAMCVNDVITTGAKPIFFLDYIACGSLTKGRQDLDEIIKSIVKGCEIAGCSLIDGETAEMPGLYGPYDYDLAGFAVGEVYKKDVIDGNKIKKGDKIFGLESSGLHSNGYSLARKIFFDKLDKHVHSYIEELGRKVGEELLTPTKIYVKEVMISKKKVKGIAHITGGGFIDNIPRIFPKGLGAEIKKGSWHIHKIFNYMQEKGEVKEEEMYKTFNMGIGMIFIADKKFKYSDIKKIEDLGTKVYEIGKVINQEGVRF
ncbi:MAG: phosphoribosylformylglycinamidine cyclo-ligase [Nanoarchaeota archaeon]|nr:phosphoribosylformylglycinamidine cyclo-ligase [Nanoarchaeota archaeon]